MNPEVQLKSIGFTKVGGCDCPGKAKEFIRPGYPFPKVNLYRSKSKFMAWIKPGQIIKGHFSEYESKLHPLLCLD